MKEIKRGHYQLSESIIECWKNHGIRYIKGKLAELFAEDNGEKYINIKAYWSNPYNDDLNLFVYEINSNEVVQLLADNNSLKYLVSHQQL
ncbi:hypothetical protein EZ428_12230 [Pedobacter frigiditerrae]|uniref:Uncharacterized protein n=1 Tax=Pedobacter frigiditerrae TaxID=2530452 RepID=A0A4R0MST5_9SPHI|nr:hypothetical protein [Pedobacter frigiditerrae]TCC90050.1 hypothetical protein EZ428_12230 [Pedobacter frigiditerrae]